MEEIIRKLESVIDRCAGGFRRRHPRFEREEVKAEAYLLAVEAVRGFDGRGDLEEYVGWFVSRRLHNSFLHPRKQVVEPRPRSSGFDLDRFLLEVSADARTVIKIALQEGSKSRTVKALKRAGWLLHSIDVVFREVREALA